MEYRTIRGPGIETVGLAMHLVFTEGWDIIGRQQCGADFEFILRRPLRTTPPEVARAA